MPMAEVERDLGALLPAHVEQPALRSGSTFRSGTSRWVSDTQLHEPG